MTTKSFFKILHTTSHREWDGPEKRILGESEWLAENGHKIIIAAPPDSALYQRAKKKKLRTYAVPFTAFSYLKDSAALKRIIQSENPDMVITHRRRDSKVGLKAAKKTGVPVKILWHHTSARVKPSITNRSLFNKADNIIFANSSSICHSLKRQFGTDDLKIFNLPFGISPFSNDILFEKTAKQKLRHMFNLENGSNFLAVASATDSELDYLLLFEALKDVEKQIPDHHLIITNGLNEKLKTQIIHKLKDFDLQDKVHFFNETDNQWKYARAFDGLVIPVNNPKIIEIENIIQNSIKSMHCGCLVIAPQCRELPELLTDKGNLLTFHPGDANDLGRNLVTAVKGGDNIQTIVDRARDAVGINHLIDQTGEFILKLFRPLYIRAKGSGWPKN